MKTGPRILFHTHNRRGLGHLMRGLNIASELLELSPTSQILFYTRGEPPLGFTNINVQFFVEPASANKSWHTVVRSFRPDMIVFDTMLPKSPRDTAVPEGVKLVYIMRKCSVDRQQEVFDHMLMDRMELILVPHSKSDFGHMLPGRLAVKSEFVGPIARRPDPSRAKALIRRYSISAHGFTLVSTPGGGGFVDETRAFLDVVFQTHELLLSELPALNHIVVKGPKYGDPVVPLQGMKLVDSEPNLVHLLALADLVISAGGYNTVTEIQVAKRPAVFLPSPRTHDDQLERVQAAASAGTARVFTNDNPAPEIARMIAKMCTSPGELAKMQQRYQLDPISLGNQNAARLMLELAAR